MKKLSLLFNIANAITFIGWGILILSYDSRLTTKAILSIIVVLLSILYTYLLVFSKNIPEERYPKGSFLSLKGIANLFQNPKNLLAGWVHYLAFDLAMGYYIKLEADSLGMNQWLLIPCLILTYLVGPIGFLVFFILKQTFYC